MKLSTKSRYGVMALVDLASHSRGRPVSLADIAVRQQISLSYLEQLFAKLRHAGLVRSVRGPGGGYLLARADDDTPVADIILAIDGPPPGGAPETGRCTPGSPAGCGGNETRCMTHELWEALSNKIHLYLSSVSLADVCARRVLGDGSAARRGTGDPGGAGAAAMR